MIDPTLAGPAAAALTAAFLWGLGSLLFEREGARVEGGRPPSPSAMNLFKNTVAFTVFVLGALLLGSRLPGRDALWPLLASGVLGFAVGDAVYFAAFPLCGVHAAAMIGILAPPMAGVLAWLFAGADFGLAAIAWMLVTLAGIAMVLLDPRASTAAAARREVPRPRRVALLGAGLALVSTLCQALGIVIAHAGFADVEVLPGTVVRLAGGLGGALLLALVPWPRVDAASGAFGRTAGGRSGVGELVRPLRDRRLARVLIVPTMVACVLSLPLHSFAVRGAPEHLATLLLATSPLFLLPLGRAFGLRHGLLGVLGTLVGFGGVVGAVLSS